MPHHSKSKFQTRQLFRSNLTFIPNHGKINHYYSQISVILVLTPFSTKENYTLKLKLEVKNPQRNIFSITRDT